MAKSKKSKKGNFKKRLKAYSVASAGVLALAPAAANAAIQYTPNVNAVIDSGNPTYLIDINGDATDDFIALYNSSPAGSTRLHMFFGYSKYNSIINSYTTTAAPPFINANLPTNYTIQSSLTSQKAWFPAGIPDGYFPATGTTPKYGYEGNFLGTTGCIGVRFNVGVAAPDFRYGWIRYQANAAATQGTIIDWAYEDTGDPIMACDTGQVATVPTLNQWALMALAGFLAAAAYRALRKLEQKG